MSEREIDFRIEGLKRLWAQDVITFSELLHLTISLLEEAER